MKNKEKKIICEYNHVYFVSKAEERKQSESNEKNYVNALISKLLRILNDDDNSNLSFEEIYRLCYKVVISGKANLLRNELNGLISKKIEDIHFNDDNFMQTLIRVFASLIDKINLMQKTLMYYENNFLKKNNFPSIQSEFITLFNTLIVNPRINQILQFLRNNIQKLRNTNNSSKDQNEDKNEICELINFIQKTNQILFNSHIEKEILNESTKYYEAKRNEIQSLSDIQSQFALIYQTYKIEQNLIKQLSISQSEAKLLSIFNTSIVSPLLFSDKQINQIISESLHSHNMQMMLQLSEICKNANNDTLCKLIANEIESIGNAKFLQFANIQRKTENDIIEFIESTFEYLTAIDLQNAKLIQHCNHTLLNKQTSIHISNFINNGNKAIYANYLPVYINAIFIMGIKQKMSYSQIESQIDKIILLFKYIRDKDVFEYQSRKYFGYRILNNLFNEKNELNFLKKLKSECGSFYTNKIEVMYNDIKTSNSLQYAKSLVYNIKILTFANWNIKKEDTINHIFAFTKNQISNANAKNFVKFQKEFRNSPFFEFTNEYIANYQKSHLNTVIYHSMYSGNCELIAKFINKKYIFVLSPLQAMICLLFNRDKTRKISLKEIKEIFNIANAKKLHKNIQPLLAVNLLNLIDENETIMSLNTQFEHKQTQIVLKLKNELSEYDNENDPNKNNIINNQRKFIIESNIIRIMKAKKKLSHIELINEIINALKESFIPDMQMTKNRIESLIERGYLKREDNYYIYLS